MKHWSNERPAGGGVGPSLVDGGNMTGRTLLWRAVELCVLVLVITSLAGQFLGQPILFAYVETGSMEPTLDPGDGYLVVPPALGGPLNQGDVIVYDAERLQGGGLVTHRVVGQTSQGFVTKGDANAFTDQDGVEPPVQRPQIVGQAVVVGGTIVRIPHLGTAVTGLQETLAGTQQWLTALVGTRSGIGAQGLSVALFALGTLLYLVSLIQDRRGPPRRRPSRTGPRRRRERRWLLILVLGVILLIPITATMVLPGGDTTVDLISAESDAPGSRVVQAGTTEEATYRVPNFGAIPLYVILEPGTEHIEMQPREATVPPRESVNATMLLSAPPETGYYREYVIEHRYLSILPVSWLRALYAVHSWLPIIVIDGIVFGAYLAVAIPLLGPDRDPHHGRSRSVPLRIRLVRLFR